MKNKNICKFIPAKENDSFETKCFILESNTATMEKHSVLDFHRVILVKNGSGSFLFDGEGVNLCAGSIVFGFEGESFRVLGGSSLEYMYISFSGTRCDGLFRRFGINKTNRCFHKFDGLIPLWYDSLSRASDDNIDLSSESILLYTFSRMNSDSAASGTLINTIIEMTEENFTDSSLSVSVIASELSYNAKYISHIFKEKMGMGYAEYLRMLRIKYAVALFDRGIDSVKNVAYLSGFSDPLYFSTVFKKVVGVSPKEYKGRGEK